MLMEGCFKGHDWRKQLIQGMEIKSFWLDKIANQIIPQLQHSFSFAFHNSYFMFNIVWPDKVFEKTLNIPKKNFQTCRTVRDSLSRLEMQESQSPEARASLARA